MKHDLWRVLNGARAYAATYRWWAILLFLLTGGGLAIDLIMVSDFELPLPIELISLAALVAIPIGLPFIAGWISPRLSHVMLLLIIVLVSVYVTISMYPWSRQYDSDPADYGIVCSLVLGGLASTAFAVGWGMRRVLDSNRNRGTIHPLSGREQRRA